MKKAARTNLGLIPHPCPLCGRGETTESVELFPARLSSQAFSEEVFSARRHPDKLHYRLVRCQHDGLVRSDPILPTAELNRLYTRSHFTYDQEVELLTQTYLTALQPVLAELDQDAHILEIGCGNGFMVGALSTAGFKNVKGVEPSAEAVNKAAKKIKKKIIQKPFSATLFKAASLDCIVIFQTLDHIAELTTFMEDCYQLLKPGGHFVSFHHDVGAWLVKLLRESHPIIDVEHTQLFDQRTSKALFAKHGFIVTQVISPANTISLRHVSTLLPIPRFLKMWLHSQRSGMAHQLLQRAVSWRLGNICIVGQKPEQIASLPTLQLNEEQKLLRRQIVEWSHQLQLSHLGSCLSCVDIISAIYQVKATDDDFILSSGHAAFAWYSVLVHQGKISNKSVKELSVHPDRKIENGISVSTGSLGQGLPIAVGKALGNRQQNVFCLTSDGEWSEGSMVEALRIAAGQILSNLTVVINFNGWGAFRETSLDQILAELRAFDVDVQQVAGHDMAALVAMLKEADHHRTRVIIAHTTVDQLPSLHGQAAHYQVLTEDEYQEAMRYLE